MAIREGRWDCRQCGSKKIRGRDMSCPGCNRKRPEGTHFYLADGEPEVTDLKQIKRAKSGSDWYCEYCKSGNKETETSCQQCGVRRDYSPKIKPLDGPPPTKEVKPKPKILGVIISALTLISIFLYIFWPRQVIVEVTGFSWERSVDIEVYKTVIEEGWDLPTNGRKLKSWRAIKSYIEVLDHYETKTRSTSKRVQTGTEEYNCGSRDLGNGYFEDITCNRPVYETRYSTETYQEPIYRDDPVYDTKYRYEIDKWIHARKESSKSNDQSPHWPEFTLVHNKNTSIGNERRGGQFETYVVYFISRDRKPKKYEERFDLNTWKSYALGGQYYAKLNLGRIRDIKPLEKLE